METGIARVTYRAGDARLHPRGLRLLPRSGHGRAPHGRQARRRLVAGAVSRVPTWISVTATPGKLVMDGCWKGPIPVKNGLIAPVEGKGLRFQAGSGGDSRRWAIRSQRRQRAHPGRQRRHSDRHGGHQLRELPRHQRRSRRRLREGLSPASPARTTPPCAVATRRTSAALMGRVHLNVGDARRNDTAHRRAAQGGPRRRRRSEPGGPVLPVRPLSPGLQQPRRRAAGQPPGHLE